MPTARGRDRNANPEEPDEEMAVLEAAYKDMMKLYKKTEDAFKKIEVQKKKVMKQHKVYRTIFNGMDRGSRTRMLMDLMRKYGGTNNRDLNKYFNLDTRGSYRIGED